MRRFRNKLSGSVVCVDDETAGRLSPGEWDEVGDQAPKPTRTRSKNK